MQLQRFFFNLGCLGGGGLMVLAAVAFGAEATRWVGFGIGVAGLLASLWFVARVVHQRDLAGDRMLRLFGHAVNPWSALGGGVLSVCIWQTVQASVFTDTVAKWITLSNGLLAGLLALIGLIAHESSSGRVIHVLEIVERGPAPRD
ncbi:MAG TPA: hypothetical protein VFT42_06345 [Solirubrobacteraceae bacterium]|nr:hypothetical protein [Solirubrobacteraceae bacterium]